ncbi:mannose-ethanolamine phosphotransferase gpi13 [Tulasnella sp. JGI-2019a]|nr:mannose-ethanolamine phosphotransferase gpi13 [Tulasnella sp. JGI-2019a]KAG8995300.1 mannose-ethanolamine phosphotransferase gpi13 [Tulasnella sp. JGI-2019a]
MITASLRGLSPISLGTLILVWILFIHGSSLYLFTRGFLLTRHALENKTRCQAPGRCTPVPATHSKAVVLIIDALRFDFISPHPPSPSDEFHHGILTLPAELTKSQPDRSFIFNAHSDPPTATLQRIKGITTGSLPTFVDLGSSFGGSSINEDSLIHQAVANGKRVAFMGDDTWETVYPNSFAPNMSWPFDSFNVEDLHTVDEGVIKHLFPLLKGQAGEWDLAIGHFLGVDHVGHRVGPSGPTMRAKLQQMDKVLRQVVNELDDDTLLIVLGDHGMDSKGDHGGDGILETSSAMWIYSKSVELSIPLLVSTMLDAKATPRVAQRVDEGLLPVTTFPGSNTPTRSVQQIDIVPTLSLLLGLPIPFNNLGMIIPELFLRHATNPPPDESQWKIDWKALFTRRMGEPLPAHPKALYRLSLNEAMIANVEQIRAYIMAYRDSPSGRELEAVFDSLKAMHVESFNPRLEPATGWGKKRLFLREALKECRTLWAQFNVMLMLCGLVALGLTVPTVWAVYRTFDADVSAEKEKRESAGVAILSEGLTGAMGGALMSGWVKIVFSRWTPSFGFGEALLLGATIGSEWAVLYSHLFDGNTLVSFAKFKTMSFHRTILPIAVLILHAASYTSNSFVMWEDRLTQYFLFTLLLPVLITSFSAPERRFRGRLLGFGAASAILLRLAAISTVCREEQHPYCHVTFYSALGAQAAPWFTTIAAPLCALVLPSVVRRFLALSESDKVTAPIFIEVVWRALLTCGAGYWLLERLENTHGLLNEELTVAVQALRTVAAQAVMVGSLMGAGSLWWTSSACVEERHIVTKGEDNEKRVQISLLGHANGYGSSYLLFVLTAFSLVFLVSQPTGQVVMSLSLIAVLSYVEVADTEKDAAALVEAFNNVSDPAQLLDDSVALQVRPQRPTFVSVAFVSIVSLATFYATGHQAVLSTIQWKTAFIGFPVVTYPFSPILVALNTFGPIALVALTIPLFALWNTTPPWPSTSPTPTESEAKEAGIVGDAVKLAVGVSLYHSALTLGTAVSAAILRRHLMVWKVFAPRFMLGAVALLCVDVALVLGVGIGVREVMSKAQKMGRFVGKKQA